MVKVKEDLTGNKYGKLMVVRQSEDFFEGKQKTAGWYVFCECNPSKIFKVRQKDLKSGHTKSCGCINAERAKELYKKVNYDKKKYSNTYDLSGDYGIGYTSKGNPFYFDLEDYDKIKNYNWHITNGYIVSRDDGGYIFMHRLVMEVTDSNIMVDHIFHRKNDNRKSQLRVCTNTENCRNTSIGKNNSSGIVGVSFNKEKGKWEATIKVNRKSIYLGRFDNITDAINCRLAAQDKYFGEFSNKDNGKDFFK